MAGPVKGFQGVYLTPEAFASAVDARVKALWPDLVRDLLEALVQRMQGEGRAAAMAAIAEPTDELVLSALADWCEEKQLPELGARVRRLPLKSGDAIIIQSDTALAPEFMARMRRHIEGWAEEHRQRTGVQIAALLLPVGFDLHAFRLKGK